jgi:hypothetical protein
MENVLTNKNIYKNIYKNLIEQRVKYNYEFGQC